MDGATLPGPLVASRLANPYSGFVEFMITLISPVTLTEGAYWVSVQAREDFTTSGQWFLGQSLGYIELRCSLAKRGGGFEVGCLTWGPQTTCLATQNGPDELFRLIGTVGGGTPTPTPTPPFGAPTPPPTPRPRPTPLPRLDTATLAAATQRKRACHPAVWAKGNFLWSQVFLWSAILASFGSAILSAGSANRILVAIFCGHSRDSHCH